MLDDLSERAASERRRYGLALKGLTGNQMQRAAGLLQVYGKHSAAIDALHKEAVERIETERAAIRAARAAEVERLRALLGDVVLLHLYERQLERMSARDRAGLLAEAADGWEKTIVSILVEGLTLPTSAALVDVERTAASITPTPWPVTWPGGDEL